MSELALPEFRETVRFLLGDHDPAEPLVTDGALDAAVKSTVRLQAVPGLALSAAQTGVTPAPTANQFALICYHTAQRWFQSHPSGYEWRSRALTEKFGNWRDCLHALGEQIHALENGVLFGGYADLRAWLAGHAGVDPGLVWTRMVGAPPRTQAPYPQIS